MEPAWDRFDFAIDVSGVYEQELAALRAYESVFSGNQRQLASKVEPIRVPIPAD